MADLTLGDRLFDLLDLDLAETLHFEERLASSSVHRLMESASLDFTSLNAETSVLTATV